MCSICGKFDIKERVERSLIEEMCASIAHRWAGRPRSIPLDIYHRLYTGNGSRGIDRMLYIDQQTLLPDTFLEKVDKASMAVGLEVRVPFLDQELVEFTATIPAKYKVRSFSTKCILKKAFLSQLPTETLRKRKHGFTPPVNPWFRNKLNGFVKDVIFDSLARSRVLFDYDYIEKLYYWHIKGRGYYHWHLWLLTVFELWCQRFPDHQNDAIQKRCITNDQKTQAVNSYNQPSKLIDRV